MDKLVLAITLLFLKISCTSAQEMEIAHLKEDGTMEVEKIYLGEKLLSTRSTFEQIPNFPFKAKVHQNFKNFRNVSIADLDGDARQEIVTCLDETLYVLNYDGTIKWQYPLEGTSNYPPAIADIDGDGDLEIALQSYGIPAVGNVYLFDHEGILQDGWPLRSLGRIFLNGVTLADLNDDGQLEVIASERISSSSGRVHALSKNGDSFDANWPVLVPGTPAFTPSVGDVNNDGRNDVVTSTTTGLYAFSAAGAVISGFPVVEEGAKFSYQSPLLADLSADKSLEIMTARHNDVSGTVVVQSDGNYYGNWPDFDNIWTYATPAVVDIGKDEDYEIFYSRPYVSESKEGDILLGYDHNGEMLDGFPIQGISGAEGVIAIADIDNDGDYELITSSKASINGKGQIQAYHIESQEVVENFPLEVEGFTFLNGAFLSDVDNDGLLDLTALSYQIKFDISSPDSAFVNVFNLQAPYNESTILFNGYKGSLSHDGLIGATLTHTKEITSKETLVISPNPANDHITVNIRAAVGEKRSDYYIVDILGRVVLADSYTTDWIDVSHLPKGSYMLVVRSEGIKLVEKFIKQ